MSNLTGCREGVFIALLLTLVCIFVGLVSPVAAIVMMIIGLWVSVQLGLFAITFDVFIGLLLMAGIVIWRIRQ